MPPDFPSFYAMRARQAFLNAYGDDENVVRAEPTADGVQVTLRDLEASVFPVHIDGVAFTYSTELPLEEAS